MTKKKVRYEHGFAGGWMAMTRGRFGTPFFLPHHAMVRIYAHSEARSGDIRPAWL